jgi:hypothetical protein
VGLLVGLVALTVWAQPRDLILRVEEGPSAWGNSRLEGSLEQTLSRDQSFRVNIVSDNDPRYPAFPGASHDLDSLTNWGMEVGGRYLWTVTVTSQRLERRKSFHVPLIFHKWESFGVIEGEMRLVDLQRNRLLLAESFREEIPAKRIIQATMDDDQNDPDLHLTAPEKIRFFKRLYAEAATQLTSRVLDRIGGNGH